MCGIVTLKFTLVKIYSSPLDAQENSDKALASARSSFQYSVDKKQMLQECMEMIIALKLLVRERQTQQNIKEVIYIARKIKTIEKVSSASQYQQVNWS